jgi:hypothetical protein
MDRLKPSLLEKYHQLGTLNADGSLPAALPAPRPASWDSEAEMSRKIHPRQHLTRLSEMEKT